ncbi:hypothetical protein V8C26DRAFT_337015 [Trichoderma gracile]
MHTSTQRKKSSPVLVSTTSHLSSIHDGLQTGSLQGSAWATEYGNQQPIGRTGGESRRRGTPCATNHLPPGEPASRRLSGGLVAGGESVLTTQPFFAFGRARLLLLVCFRLNALMPWRGKKKETAKRAL